MAAARDGRSIAPELRDLRRQLNELKTTTGIASSAPDMIVILRFSTDDAQTVQGYVTDLHAAFREATPYIEVLELAQPRPAHLKPAWNTPRQWLDYRPHPAELADLRPDLRPPTFSRVDWTAPSAATLAGKDTP